MRAELSHKSGISFGEAELAWRRPPGEARLGPARTGVRWFCGCAVRVVRCGDWLNERQRPALRLEVDQKVGWRRQHLNWLTWVCGSELEVHMIEKVGSEEEMWKAALRGVRHMPAVDGDELELFAYYLKDSEARIGEMEGAEPRDPDNSGLVVASYFARRIRYSHVVYLYSLLEEILKRECARLHSLDGGRFPVPPAEKPHLMKQYLESNAGFKVPKDISDSTRRLGDVRHVIVHNNGYVDMDVDKRSQRLVRLRTMPGINLVDEAIEVELGFLETSLAGISAFERLLHEQFGRMVDQVTT